MDLFKWLEEITVKKRPIDFFTENDWSSFNSYLIHKYLSMNMGYIELVNYVQKLPHDNKKQIYSIYKDMIPKRKVWLKYIGPKKKKNNTDELADYIAKHFECSLGEADEYIDLLGKKGVTSILYKFGIEDKEIKKLLK